MWKSHGFDYLFLLKTAKAVTGPSRYYGGTDGKLGARKKRTRTKTNKLQTGRTPQ
jgi:hypothetical protein